MSMDVRVGNADDLKTFRDTIMRSLEKSISNISWDGEDRRWIVEAAGGSGPWLIRRIGAGSRWRVRVSTAGITLGGVALPQATCFFEVVPDTLNFPRVRFDITVMNTLPTGVGDYKLQDTELVDLIAKIVREQGASKSWLAAFLGV